MRGIPGDIGGNSMSIPPKVCPGVGNFPTKICTRVGDIPVLSRSPKCSLWGWMGGGGVSYIQMTSAYQSSVEEFK